MGLARIPNGRVLVAGGDVSLYELDVRTGQTQRLLQVRLQGAVTDLAVEPDDPTVGYLYSHYQVADNEARGAVIRFRLPAT